MQKHLSPKSAAASFLLVSSSVAVLIFVGQELWSIIWTDIVKSNPGRSVYHAILVLPIMSAIVGVFMLIVHYSGALITAGTGVYMAVRAFGRVSFPALLIISAACIAAIYSQDALLPDYHFYTDTLEQSAVSADALKRNIRRDAYFLPALISAWLPLFRMHEWSA